MSTALRISGIIAMVAATALAGCALPPRSQTASAGPHHYEDPDTGSLFGGGDKSNLSSGKDPGLLSVNQNGPSGH